MDNTLTYANKFLVRKVSLKEKENKVMQIEVTFHR
jgi:hypothetical protein